MLYLKHLVIILSGAFLGNFAMAIESDVTPEIRAVQEDSQFKPHVGLGLGFGDPNGTLDAGGNYSIEAGFQPVIPLSIIGDFTVENYNQEGPGKLVRNRFFVKANYNFGGDIPFIRYTYVGLGAGPMWEDTNFDNELAFGLMPNAGFDYPLDHVIDRSPLSLGANVSHLYSSSDTPDVFAVKGVVKYWY